MCARYALFRVVGLGEEFDITLPVDIVPRYNIAPTQQVLAVLQTEEGREAKELRWGLIPFWSKDASIAQKLINAKSETISEKPAFRDAFRQRRCILPADGFYEWKTEGKAKQPYLIERVDGKKMALAALHESWRDPSGEKVETCTIVTTRANEAMEGLHDRMPVILEGDKLDAWLDPESGETILEAIMEPIDSDAIRMRPVNRLLGNPRNEGQELLNPPDQQSLF